MSKDNGGYAFQIVVGDQMTPGMTLRDYFAAKVMQGMIANPFWDNCDFSDVAEAAYEQADAMLAVREKGE